MTDLREAALELASSGVAVFPCNADKSPRVAGGFKSASTDPDTIRSWSWADAMIGAAIPEGTFVLDIDPRNGGDGTMALLRTQGHELPPTRTVHTRGGGWHYHYTIPKSTNLRGRLGPGVDIKKAGKGYVITPPSPGYEITDDSSAAPAPKWLLDELIVANAIDGSDETSPPKYFAFQDATPYGLAALEREVGRLGLTPEGERNDALNAAAFALAQLTTGGEIRRERVLADLLAVAEHIGLEHDEALATIESGWRAGGGPAPSGAVAQRPASAGHSRPADVKRRLGCCRLRDF